MHPLLLLTALSAPAADAADYTRDVKPILAQRCVGCHGPQKQRGGLRLDAAATIRKGGNKGPAVVPGKSADSLLVKAVTAAEGVKSMPPKGPPLAADEIAVLTAWIDAGAAVPADEVVAPAASKHW